MDKISIDIIKFKGKPHRANSTWFFFSFFSILLNPLNPEFFTHTTNNSVKKKKISILCNKYKWKTKQAKKCASKNIPKFFIIYAIFTKIPRSKIYASKTVCWLYANQKCFQYLCMHIFAFS